jgi:hypothetical protein
MVAEAIFRVDGASLRTHDWSDVEWESHLGPVIQPFWATIDHHARYGLLK